MPLAEEIFEHHYWATSALIDHCMTLAPDTLDLSVPGTFGTVVATLRHLSGADERYLAVLEGRPLRPELMEGAELDLPAQARGAADRAERWRRLLASGPDLARVITRRRQDGSDETVVARTLFVQAIHHGNDHRTHVCTVLGALGQPVPDLQAWTLFKTT